MATTELNRQAAGPDLALESNNDDVRSKLPKQIWERRLSAVEGFDPKQYARTIRDSNGQESLYLDVQYRKMLSQDVVPPLQPHRKNRQEDLHF